MGGAGQACSNDVLAILLASCDFVSGEYLSKSLGISRTAVWKRISGLKKEGYLIEASTNKGYRILSREAHFGKAGIQSLIKTDFIGRELKFLHTVDSTNAILKSMADEGAPEGAVVIADEQTLGRGRLGRSWSSLPGLGIWMSVLLRPKLHPALIQSITPAIAVAVCRALEPYLDARPGIKWPNDILIEGRKVCGILTELSAEAEMISWVVAGLGINVNHEISDFPEELKNQATSVRMHLKSGMTINRCKIASGIINQFEAVYIDFISNGFGAVLREWKDWSVTIGRKVLLIQNNIETIATALDIGADGRLIVQLDDGCVKEVFSGEISLRNL